MSGFANSYRGLKISGTDFSYFSEGAFGLIFVNGDRTRMRKVYKNHEAGKAHCKSVFDAEVEAYQLAMCSPKLKPFVPNFQGVILLQIVIDRDGKDISSETHPEFAFEAEFISGDFQKFHDLTTEKRAPLEDLFHKAGIHYLRDMSVTINEGEVHKAIDFAVRDIELMHVDTLGLF